VRPDFECLECGRSNRDHRLGSPLRPCPAAGRSRRPRRSSSRLTTRWRSEPSISKVAVRGLDTHWFTRPSAVTTSARACLIGRCDGGRGRDHQAWQGQKRPNFGQFWVSHRSLPAPAASLSGAARTSRRDQGRGHRAQLFLSELWTGSRIAVASCRVASSPTGVFKVLIADLEIPTASVPLSEHRTTGPAAVMTRTTFVFALFR
jgi:hypothetical protein